MLYRIETRDLQLSIELKSGCNGKVVQSLSDRDLMLKSECKLSSDVE